MSLPQKPTLEVPIDLESVYSNLVRIAHSPADFVFDFAHLLPGAANAIIGARILMTPLSAKLLLNALTENVSRYEVAFGNIEKPIGNSTLGEITYSAPTSSKSTSIPKE